jgi:hypothetical protein
MKLIDFITEFKYVEPRDEAHYRQLMKDLQDIQKDPKQYATVGKLNFMKRKAALDAWADKNLKKEDMAAEPAKCTHCDGTGKHGDKECSVCGGRGFVTEDNIEERMPASIIKHKEKLAYMSDKELANHFKDKDDDTLRQMAWRHGYGKMSDHYVNRKNKGMSEDASEDEEDEFHRKLDKLVHKTFGHSSDEKKKKKEKQTELRTKETNEGEMRLDKQAFVDILANKIKEPQKGLGRPEYDNRLLAKMYKLITGADVDFEGNKFTITTNKPTTEDIDDKGRIALEKAGFDPSKVKEYLAVFNDHGDTSDIEQMNMDKVGLADAMSMVLASHDVKNESTNEDSVSEGAEMIAYHKHPKDNNLWTFPDAYKDDKEVESPYMSNASMRQFLSTLGYNPDFEDQSPVPAKEFIARTTQWLQKNIDKKSPEEPTTIDKNPDGPTMISGGKPEGYMNRQVKLHNELARKIIAKYPEVTHLGFN